MSKVLILAPTGFGKSTAIGRDDELGIKGLNPEETYIISVTSKPLPFRRSEAIYPSTTSTAIEHLKVSRRFISNNAKDITTVLGLLALNPKLKNIVLDDSNYIMQDYYMKKALSTGWDTPKKIGYDMGQIFDALEVLEKAGKNCIVLAHFQLAKLASDESRVQYEMKTTGEHFA